MRICRRKLARADCFFRNFELNVHLVNVETLYLCTKISEISVKQTHTSACKEEMMTLWESRDGSNKQDDYYYTAIVCIKVRLVRRLVDRERLPYRLQIPETANNTFVVENAVVEV